MSVKPILFNTDMVRAILDNRKTVTRRVVKGYALYHLELDTDGSIIGVYNQDEGHVFPVMDYAPYRPGDILYVRETFFEHKGRFYYKADGKHETLDKLGITFKWHPSIHMPREAARIFLRVTDVRVERLQGIDDDGVVAEGLEIGAPFDELWDSTIKPADRALYGWEANPWVWVIEFERISREEARRDA